MNMKRLFLLLCVNVIFTLCVYAGQAKYVFYFIGDGMGLAEVIGTQYMLRQCQTGEVGITPLCFAQFPYTGFAINNSYNSDVTDSSAAGTALATGHKTKNGVLGMLPDKVTPVNSIATWAKAAHRSVGIATSVSVNNATPAAFYSHSASRNDYYNIGEQLAATDFEFFGGSDFQKGYPKDKPSLVELAEKGGFTVVRGKKAYEDARNDAKKIVMLFDYRTTDGDFPYAIDAKPGELTLAEMTVSAVDFLMKKNNGFFLMVEGGKIDHAGHSNDAAACLKDVIAMDDAVKVAFEFYKKHKKETLIVITADHETGGLTLRDPNGHYSDPGTAFSTHSHTCLPVMVFAYGPGAEQFTGWMENSDLKGKILNACGIESKENKTVKAVRTIAPVKTNFDSNPKN